MTKPLGYPHGYLDTLSPEEAKNNRLTLISWSSITLLPFSQLEDIVEPLPSYPIVERISRGGDLGKAGPGSRARADAINHIKKNTSSSGTQSIFVNGFGPQHKYCSRLNKPTCKNTAKSHRKKMTGYSKRRSSLKMDLNENDNTKSCPAKQNRRSSAEKCLKKNQQSKTAGSKNLQNKKSSVKTKKSPLGNSKKSNQSSYRDWENHIKRQEKLTTGDMETVCRTLSEDYTYYQNEFNNPLLSERPNPTEFDRTKLRELAREPKDSNERNNDPAQVAKKTIDEARSALQAEREGLIQNPSRADKETAQRVDLDGRITGPEPWKFFDAKHIVGQHILDKQGRGITLAQDAYLQGTKFVDQVNKYVGVKDGPKNVGEVLGLVDLHYMQPHEKPIAKAQFLKGVEENGGVPESIAFLNDNNSK